MKFITFREFRRLSGLSDRVLLALLEEAALNLEVDEELGLIVDLEGLKNHKLLEAICERRDAEEVTDRAQLVETAARVIRAELDQVLNEVLQRIETSKQ